MQFCCSDLLSCSHFIFLCDNFYSVARNVVRCSNILYNFSTSLCHLYYYLFLYLEKKYESKTRSPIPNPYFVFSDSLNVNSDKLTSLVSMIPTKGNITAGTSPVIIRGIASVIQSRAVARITHAARPSLFCDGVLKNAKSNNSK